VLTQDSGVEQEMLSAPGLVGEVRDGRLLVVTARDAEAIDALQSVLSRTSKRDESSSERGWADGQIKTEGDGDEDDGRNHRGTYSKAYTVMHPEIRWVHRGQGRYLPIDAAKALQSQT
jgi:hypothetical protein